VAVKVVFSLNEVLSSRNVEELEDELAPPPPTPPARPKPAKPAIQPLLVLAFLSTLKSSSFVSTTSVGLGFLL